MIFQPGQLILNDKYRVEDLVGRGAFGEVYHATHLRLNAPRAVKVLRRDAPGVGSTVFQTYRDRFALEAQLGARLDHPHVIKVHDFEEADGRLYLVLEYGSAGSLADRLESGHPLSIEEAVRLGLDLCAGLAAIHEKLRAVHRDVKPSNILFDAEGQAKIGDLGLLQMAAGPSQRSQLGSLAGNHPGTPAYMSPEQEREKGYLLPTSDIFSLGCVLFEALTGIPYKSVYGTTVAEHRPDVPPWLNEVIARALAEAPGRAPADDADAGKRYRTAGQMRAELERRRQIGQAQKEEEARQARAAAERLHREAEARAQEEAQRKREIEERQEREGAEREEVERRARQEAGRREREEQALKARYEEERSKRIAAEEQARKSAAEAEQLRSLTRAVAAGPARDLPRLFAVAVTVFALLAGGIGGMWLTSRDSGAPVAPGLATRSNPAKPSPVAALPTGVAVAAATAEPASRSNIATPAGKHIEARGLQVFHLATWSQAGTGDRFVSPRGVAADAAGNLYVVAREIHQVQKFSTDGRPLGKWGSEGRGDGQFRYPTAIVAGTGGIYVADGGNSRVQRFGVDGQFLGLFDLRGKGDAEVISPSGIAVDGLGNVYVADRRTHQVQKFSTDGRSLGTWGGGGSGDGQFLYPTAIAAGTGGIYVADEWNRRVQRFSADGRYLGKWGSVGDRDDQFQLPIGLAVDSVGNVYVTDGRAHRVQKFSSDGQILGQWGSRGIADGQLDSPTGITVDGAGIVYVADAGNHRIQKFAVP